MKYLFLSLCILSSVIHLFASYKKNNTLRGVTKGWILLALMAFYVTATNNPSWLVLLAVFFSWLGDVLLIPKGNKWFTVGGIAFWVSHFLFIASYIEAMGGTLANVSLPLIIILGLVDIGAVLIEFKFLKSRLPKPLVVPMFAYLLTNGAMNCFAWFMFSSLHSVGALITAIAALFFFISDCTLFFVRFGKNAENKSHFFVMLTYIIAELFIVLGFVI